MPFDILCILLVPFMSEKFDKNFTSCSLRILQAIFNFEKFQSLNSAKHSFNFLKITAVVIVWRLLVTSSLYNKNFMISLTCSTIASRIISCSASLSISTTSLKLLFSLDLTLLPSSSSSSSLPKASSLPLSSSPPTTTTLKNYIIYCLKIYINL